MSETRCCPCCSEPLVWDSEDFGIEYWWCLVCDEMMSFDVDE